MSISPIKTPVSSERTSSLPSIREALVEKSPDIAPDSASPVCIPELTLTIGASGSASSGAGSFSPSSPQRIFQRTWEIRKASGFGSPVRFLSASSNSLGSPSPAASSISQPSSVDTSIVSPLAGRASSAAEAAAAGSGLFSPSADTSIVSPLAERASSAAEAAASSESERNSSIREEQRSSERAAPTIENRRKSKIKSTDPETLQARHKLDSIYIHYDEHLEPLLLSDRLSTFLTTQDADDFVLNKKRYGGLMATECKNSTMKIRRDRAIVVLTRKALEESAPILHFALDDQATIFRKMATDYAKLEKKIALRETQRLLELNIRPNIEQIKENIFSVFLKVQQAPAECRTPDCTFCEDTKQLYQSRKIAEVTQAGLDQIEEIRKHFGMDPNRSLGKDLQELCARRDAQYNKIKQLEQEFAIKYPSDDQ